MDGGQIHDGRTKRNMSRRELADLVGVTDRTVAHWENGERVPSYGHLQRLRAVLFGQGQPAVALDDVTRIAALEVRVAALERLVRELAGARLSDDPQT